MLRRFPPPFPGFPEVLVPRQSGTGPSRPWQTEIHSFHQDDVQQATGQPGSPGRCPEKTDRPSNPIPKAFQKPVATSSRVVPSARHRTTTPPGLPSDDGGSIRSADHVELAPVLTGSQVQPFAGTKDAQPLTRCAGGHPPSPLPLVLRPPDRPCPVGPSEPPHRFDGPGRPIRQVRRRDSFPSGILRNTDRFPGHPGKHQDPIRRWSQRVQLGSGYGLTTPPRPSTGTADGVTKSEDQQ